MNSSIDILEEKKMHLEDFYRLNESALEKFKADDFSDLEEFYKTREGILDIIRKLDEMLERVNQTEGDQSKIDLALKKSVMEALEHKNILVTQILEQDLNILSVLETAKSEIIKELTQVRGAKKAIGAYHSGNNKSRLSEKV